MPVPAATGRLRAWVAHTLGVSGASRLAVLRAMFDKGADDHALYWLELLLAMGIATFGLVLDSVGVVIGAMLIAPLMTPIVELSMSLVITSAHLLVTALTRVVASVVVVVLGAALITRLLPFQVATPEILARTSPTVLDLFVAIFCAVAAAAVTARPLVGATSTAAGTAIGISLVPPLCAAGFGLGSGDRAIAEGASLLFTANVCAILTFAALFFWVVGFRPQADAVPLPARGGRIAALQRAIAGGLERRVSPQSRAVFRVLVPAGLLVLVAVPLTRALQELSYEVRARATLSRLVQEEPLLADAIRFEPVFDRGVLRVHAVVVGSDSAAQQLQGRVARALASVRGGEVPTVQVRAVPQASAAERTTEARRRGEPAPAPAPPTVGEAARAVHAAVTRAVTAAVPADVALDVRTSVVADGTLRLDLALAGDPLDAAGRGILERVLATTLGTPVQVETSALPVAPLAAPVTSAAAWLDDIGPALEALRRFPALTACVTMPPVGRLQGRPPLLQVRTRLQQRLGEWSAGRVTVTEGAAWSLAIPRGACAALPDTATTLAVAR